MKRVMLLCCAVLCIGGICCIMFKEAGPFGGGNSQCVSLDSYRRFLAEATAFDFCGAGYTSNDVNNLKNNLGTERIDRDVRSNVE